MTRDQKIVAIYKEMANKELTLGCKVKFSKWIYSIIDREDVWFLSSYKGQDWDIYNTIEIEDGVNSRCYSIEEIIWHPVMIWDVLDWIEPYWSGYVQSVEFTDRRRKKKNLVLLQRDNKRLPIDEQSDECIDYVYGLISSKSME